MSSKLGAKHSSHFSFENAKGYFVIITSMQKQNSGCFLKQEWYFRQDSIMLAKRSTCGFYSSVLRYMTD